MSTMPTPFEEPHEPVDEEIVDVLQCPGVQQPIARPIAPPKERLCTECGYLHHPSSPCPG